MIEKSTLGLSITAGVLGLFFIITLALAIVYGVKYNNLKKEKDELQTTSEASLNDVNAKLRVANAKKCPECPVCPADKTEDLAKCNADAEAYKKANPASCSADLMKCSADLMKCSADFDTYKNANPATCVDELETCNANYLSCSDELKTCKTPTAAPVTTPAVVPAVTVPDVQVPLTVANVTQSSFFNASSFPAANLVDGNPATFAHTKTGDKEWIKITLASDMPITKIIIANRTDCCQDRMIGVVLTILNAANASVFTQTFTSALAEYVITPPVNTVGKVIQLQRPNSGTALNIGDMKVFTKGTTSVAPALDSYAFVQGYDPVGSNVFTAARSDIANNPVELAKVCSATAGCQGFNTNGWFKKDIVPNSKTAWGKWTTEANKGAYILKTLAPTYAPTPIPAAAPTPAVSLPAYINYKFPSAGGYCVDVAGASKNAGARIDGWDCGSVEHQYFMLDTTSKQLKAKHSNMCLGAGATAGNVTQQICDASATQKWTKVANTDGTFTLKNDGNSLCMTLSGGKDSNVTTAACTNANNQKLKN
jgi:hypothetical protein